MYFKKGFRYCRVWPAGGSVGCGLQGAHLGGCRVSCRGHISVGVGCGLQGAHLGGCRVSCRGHISGGVGCPAGGTSRWVKGVLQGAHLSRCGHIRVELCHLLYQE